MSLLYLFHTTHGEISLCGVIVRGIIYCRGVIFSSICADLKEFIEVQGVRIDGLDFIKRTLYFPNTSNKFPTLNAPSPKFPPNWELTAPLLSAKFEPTLAVGAPEL